jgi:hypothetical protein
MSLRLAEFVTQIAVIEKNIIESNGELSPELEKQLLQIDLSKREAVDSVQITLDRLEALSDYWKRRADGYTRVSKSLEISAAKLKRHVKDIMAASGTEDLYGLEWRLKLCPAKPKVVVNEETLPREYLKEKITFVPDKGRIEEEIKMGVPIEGVTLEPVYTLRSYPNKKEIS